MNTWLVAGALMLVGLSASAQDSPIGLWKTIHDDGKTEKSLVRITEAGGVLTGKIERIFDAEDQDSTCDKCPDERKDQPVLGMVILRYLKQDAHDGEIWTGGEILDPDNGKTYRVRLKTLDGGRQLQVRGYLGPFYRTQVWQRVE
jgi:uncharacterized protein (DUF2147 family)